MASFVAARKRVDAGLILTAVVLLVGIVALAAGFYSGDRRAFYGGLTVTVGGVLNGIRRLVLRV
jgi:hypothetical protein